MMIEILKLLIIVFVLSDMGVFLSELIPTPKNKIIAIPVLIIRYWLSCAKCFSFWFSLFYTGDLFISALMALVVNVLKELQYKLIKTEL